MHMAKIPWFRVLLMLAAFLIGTRPAAADSVQLANGEVLKGKVLTLDDKQVTLESESLGKVAIPRSKVATITLGEAKPPALVADPKANPAPANPQPASSVEEAFKQLKAVGANPKEVGELQKLFPELSSPEASKYFDETLKGVMSGKKNIQDIRKDAIKARDELKKLTEDLGDDVGAATAPYLNILEKFIRETEPKNEPATQPEKKAAPPEKK
jgi:hypothetical protein